MSNHDIETELRDAVRSYAAGVQPADRLGAIRPARPGGSRDGSRPWVLVAGAALAAAAVVVGAVSVAGPERTGGGPPVAGSDHRDVTVYMVGEVGGRPWLYPEQVDTVASDSAAYDAALALIGDGSDESQDRWTGCPWGHLDSVEVSDTAVTVTLAGQAAACDMDPAYAEAQQQQLRLDGARRRWVRSPRRPDARRGPCWDPATAHRRPGRAVAGAARLPRRRLRRSSSPVTVEGRGNTFEGNVQWQVLSGDASSGTPVADGFETAGTMGRFRPFRFTVDLPPGVYTVRAFESSAEDGSLFAEDTRLLHRRLAHAEGSDLAGLEEAPGRIVHRWGRDRAGGQRQRVAARTTPAATAPAVDVRSTVSPRRTARTSSTGAEGTSQPSPRALLRHPANGASGAGAPQGPAQRARRR